MLRKSVSTLMVGALLAGTLTFPVSAQAADYTIYVEDQKVSYTQSSGQPFLDNQERTQVPLRLTMETFGCAVSWNEPTKTAILKMDGKTVRVPVGKSYIEIDGVKKTTDTQAIVIDGRTYLPIRPVLEAFGATVTWDSTKNAVVVTKDGKTTELAAGSLGVHFIDVGQADAILIDNGAFEVLIDGGNNKDGMAVVAYLKDYVDGDLDLLIGTHPDADHIGGLDDVLGAYDVRKVIDSGSAKETKTYTDYWTAVTSEPNCTVMEDSDMTLDLGSGVTLTLIETGDGYKDANDNSVVAQLSYGEVSVLLTGDMEKAAEAAALERFGKVTVLKAGHHGSSTSSSQAFLDRVQPQYVIISAGKNNSYKHPHKEVLERFFAANATVYGTFRSGTIVMTTDGKTVSFNTSDKVVLADAGNF